MPLIWLIATEVLGRFVTPYKGFSRIRVSLRGFSGLWHRIPTHQLCPKQAELLGTGFALHRPFDVLVLGLPWLHLNTPQSFDRIRYLGVAHIDDHCRVFIIQCQPVIRKPAKAFDIFGLLRCRRKKGKIAGRIEFGRGFSGEIGRCYPPTRTAST